MNTPSFYYHLDSNIWDKLFACEVDSYNEIISIEQDFGFFVSRSMIISEISEKLYLHLGEKIVK